MRANALVFPPAATARPIGHCHAPRWFCNSYTLVSRFRSSHHHAARSFANFGIKGTLAIYDSSAVVGFEVPTQTRGYNDRNFKSTALGDAIPCKLSNANLIVKFGPSVPRERTFLRCARAERASGPAKGEPRRKPD